MRAEERRAIVVDVGAEINGCAACATHAHRLTAAEEASPCGGHIMAKVDHATTLGRQFVPLEVEPEH
jgi:hypothetical protein